MESILNLIIYSFFYKIAERREKAKKKIRKILFVLFSMVLVTVLVLIGLGFGALSLFFYLAGFSDLGNPALFTAGILAIISVIILGIGKNLL